MVFTAKLSDILIFSLFSEKFHEEMKGIVPILRGYLPSTDYENTQEVMT